MRAEIECRCTGGLEESADVIEVDDIRARYRQAAKFLDERGRRLFAANEALAIGYGGVTAASAATGLARSTIRRAIVELQGGSNPIGSRVRRPGGGRKRAVALQPGCSRACRRRSRRRSRTRSVVIRRRRCAGSAAASARSPGPSSAAASGPARSWWACCYVSRATVVSWATVAKP